MKYDVIYIRPKIFLGLKAELVTHLWSAKDLYNAALALHLKVLLLLLYNDDMVSFRPPFFPYNYY